METAVSGLTTTSLMPKLPTTPTGAESDANRVPYISPRNKLLRIDFLQPPAPAGGENSVYRVSWRYPHLLYFTSDVT